MMSSYYLLSSDRGHKPALDLDYMGEYYSGEVTGRLINKTVPVDNVENLLQHIKEEHPEVEFVFDRFLSKFKTEFNARLYLAVATNSDRASVRIVDWCENGWLDRFARMARLLDLETQIQSDPSETIHHLVRQKPAARGFGSVRLEPMEAILSNACGVKNFELLSPEAMCSVFSHHIEEKIPLSYIRFNHCEPRVLGLDYVFNIADVNDTAKLQWGRDNVTTNEVTDISDALRKSVRNADVVGIPRNVNTINKKLSVLENSCFVLFRDFRLLQPNARFIHVNAHLSLGESSTFYNVLRSARTVNLISGRNVVAGLSARIGRSDINWISIPVEHGHAQGDQTGNHFPEAFNAIIHQLRTTVRPGDLYLVGGGVLGKIYCDVVRAAGGIGLDIGSLFDAWAGKSTRGQGFSDTLKL